MQIESEKYAYIPAKDINYVMWGHFNKVLKVIKAKTFYPIWITGLSGNGKTQMIEQACAVANLPEEYFDPKTKQAEKDKIIQKFKDEGKEIGREFIRVNFTLETDENDLIGGFRLQAGDTVFHEGPVVTALRRGAVLLLDELDVGHTNKIMCLQSVLEGKGVLVKATGEYVLPAPGFQIFATSNTKGKGSDDGRFIGTQIMNAAFLDRFAGMIFQEYPPSNVEEYILKRYLVDSLWKNKGREEKDITKEELHTEAKFVAKLCEWAQQLRNAMDKGASTESITTRSLINIIQGYAILGDKDLAIGLACERYDEVTRQTFISMYEKLSDSDFVPEKDLTKKKEKEEERKYA